MTTNFMVTITGSKFYPDAIGNSVFKVEDIAHALSNLCRFGGHTTAFYSVAEHSVLVSRIVQDTPGTRPVDWLAALMHDASEAYLVDVPSPVKPLLKGYKELEHEVMAAIFVQLGLTHGDEDVIKRADMIALATEAKQFIHSDVSDWPVYRSYQPLPNCLLGMRPSVARDAFRNRYYELRSILEAKVVTSTYGRESDARAERA